MDTAQLRPDEMEAHLANGTFRLAFVGMSNAGKSYRSRILQNEEGFLWYQVDKAIQKALRFDEMSEISDWLGMPTNPTYPEREAKYLALEDEYTKHAAMRTGGKNFVFDTTGSVAHLAPSTIDVLKANCLVVHLDVGEDSLEKMMQKFREEPKPVAWCGYFTITEGESEQEAFERCYPKLLHDRLAAYRTLAHINIPTLEIRDTSGKETLGVIKSHLAR